MPAKLISIAALDEFEQGIVKYEVRKFLAYARQKRSAQITPTDPLAPPRKPRRSGRPKGSKNKPKAASIVGK